MGKAKNNHISNSFEFTAPCLLICVVIVQYRKQDSLFFTKGGHAANFTYWNLVSFSCTTFSKQLAQVQNQLNKPVI